MKLEDYAGPWAKTLGVVRVRMAPLIIIKGEVTKERADKSDGERVLVESFPPV